MNRDDIIRMAREAGFLGYESRAKEIHNFAAATEKEIRALVSRAARLAVDDASLGSFGPHEKTIIDNLDFLYWLVKLAKDDEREACARVIDLIALKYQKKHYASDENVADECAAAIRARGQG